MRRVAAVAGAVSVVVGVSASGCTGGGSPAEPTDREARPPADLVQVRAVESSSPRPCGDGAFELEDECLVLGPVAIDARDIRAVVAVPAPPMGRSLSVELTPAGEEKFDALATAQLGRRVAVLVDGVVVSAPMVNDASFSASVTITGLSDEQLRRVTDGFGGDGS